MKPVIQRACLALTCGDRLLVTDTGGTLLPLPWREIRAGEDELIAARRLLQSLTGDDGARLRILGVEEREVGAAIIRQHVFQTSLEAELPAVAGAFWHPVTDLTWAFRHNDVIITSLHQAIAGEPPAFDPITAPPAAFLQEWRRARQALDALLAPLTPAELEEPGMTGDWSGRLTLVHIARWDEVATEMILRRRLGVLPGVDEYADYEWWNLQWAAVDATIPLETAWQRYYASHEAVVRTALSIPPEGWDAVIRGWLQVVSLEHYQHHTATIRAWMARRGGGAD